MSSVAHVRAQAKVNLFLRIMAREASGYHALETLFARVDLADEVTVRVVDRGRSVDCRGADVGPAESNLALRAADAYARATDWPRGFAIEIDKHIPVGGGLGGGSADAGAVLRALNALSPHPVESWYLHGIAADLGADVPFLTATTPCALAWGRGDRMLALPALPAREIGLVCFPFGVSSAAAFGWIDEVREGPLRFFPFPPMTVGDLGSWDWVTSVAVNDFDDVVAKRHPQIGAAIRVAKGEGAIIAQLTGSGSTVVIVPQSGGDLDRFSLPGGAALVRTRTAASVEDVRLTG